SGGTGGTGGAGGTGGCMDPGDSPPDESECDSLPGCPDGCNVTYCKALVHAYVPAAARFAIDCLKTIGSCESFTLDDCADANVCVRPAVVTTCQALLDMCPERDLTDCETGLAPYNQAGLDAYLPCVQNWVPEQQCTIGAGVCTFDTKSAECPN